MALTDYFEVKSDTDGSRYKIKAFYEGSGDAYIQPKRVRRNVKGSLRKQVGPAYSRFIKICKIKETPDSGYAGPTDLKRWAGATTSGHINLTLWDNDGVSYNVMLINDIERTFSSPMYQGNGYTVVPLVFETR